MIIWLCTLEYSSRWTGYGRITDLSIDLNLDRIRFSMMNRGILCKITSKAQAAASINHTTDAGVSPSAPSSSLQHLAQRIQPPAQRCGPQGLRTAYWPPPPPQPVERAAQTAQPPPTTKAKSGPCTIPTPARVVVSPAPQWVKKYINSTNA